MSYTDELLEKLDWTPCDLTDTEARWLADTLQVVLPAEGTTLQLGRCSVGVPCITRMGGKYSVHVRKAWDLR